MNGRMYIGKLKQAQSSHEYAAKICELLCLYQDEFDYLTKTVEPWSNLIQELVINGSFLSPQDIRKTFAKHLNHKFEHISDCYNLMFIITEHRMISKVLDVMDSCGLEFNIVGDNNYIDDATILTYYFEPTDIVLVKKAYQTIKNIKGPYSDIEVHFNEFDEEGNYIRINLTKEGKVTLK